MFHCRLASIVGAHRQYSKMFHSFGHFQNGLSDISNLSIFCILTRHFFLFATKTSWFLIFLYWVTPFMFIFSYFSVGNNRTRSNQDKIPFNNSDKSKTHPFQLQLILHAQEFPLFLCTVWNCSRRKNVYSPLGNWIRFSVLTCRMLIIVYIVSHHIRMPFSLLVHSVNVLAVHS